MCSPACFPVHFETLVDRGSHLELVTHATRPGRLLLARWAFPGWVVSVEGKPGAWHASLRGQLEVEIPAGDAHVTADLRPPLLRRVGLLISGIAFVTWTAMLVALGYRARRATGRASERAVKSHA